MNENRLEESKQAVLLLTCHFSEQKKGDPTPLTQIEYGRFAFWLKENAYQPKDLFYKAEEIWGKWKDPKSKITSDRLKFLLGRGMAMGMALEKWQSAGIWVLSRSEPQYPVRLKKQLRENAPAVLFGVGNKRLLNAGGLAVVGSRKIDDDDRKFTKNIARQAALEGLNIVSGGAKGVDEEAMLAAAEIDGTSLGVLANDLFKAALSSKWRSYLKGNQVTLVSPFYPEAGFHVGNAMGRNKFIYCLSDYALVVRAEEGSGGTWAGAIENSKRNWVPLFVKSDSDASGNIALIQKGVTPLEQNSSERKRNTDWLSTVLIGDINVAADLAPPNKSDTVKAELTEESNAISEKELEEDSVSIAASTSEPKLKTKSDVAIETSSVEVKSESNNENPEKPVSDYDDFLERVKSFLEQHDQITLTQMKEQNSHLGVKKITGWLDRACVEGLLERQGRRRTYVIREPDKQSDLFE